MQIDSSVFPEGWRNSETGPGKSRKSADLESLTALVRRQWLVIVLCISLGIAAGIIRFVTAVPLYSSSVKVMLDRGNGEIVQQLSLLGGTIEDETSILSQIEVLSSESIALSVVDKMNLATDRDFLATADDLMAATVEVVRSLLNHAAWFSSAETEGRPSEESRRSAADKLLRNMTVSRVERTYVLDIAYQSPSADQSAAIANSIGEAYINDKLNSKYEATRRASDWLQDRIAELKQRSIDADLAVQKFRSANGLIVAGSTLVADQQLSELNSALIVAQSDTARARARLARIQQIVASGQSNAIVTDVLGSAISNDLRQKYLEAAQREAQISDRLGQNHIQAVRLRGEMAEYTRQMFQELNRISESHKSDLDVAQAREKGLADSVSRATGISATANETQVQLRELERESETYRNMYETFLHRYQEALQQQSFPVTEARLISYAVPAKKPSEPKFSVTLALFGMMGAVAGCWIAGFREFRDRFFRTAEQVREALSLECVGTVPLVKQRSAKPEPGSILSESVIRKRNLLTNYVVDHPTSIFAETLRSAKISVDLRFPGKRCKIIGIVSSLPGEGKSTISINFAKLMALQGSRVVLMDGDLRNPGATRLMDLNGKAGLLEALKESLDVRALLMVDEKTNLSFLPAVVKQRVPHSSELLASQAMQGIITMLSLDADYLIIDLPPLGPVVDARAIADRLDCFLFVTEWGRTSRRIAEQVLRTNAVIHERCAGVVLNKVDQDRMKLYRSYGSSDYYHSHYLQYYTSDPAT